MSYPPVIRVRRAAVPEVGEVTPNKLAQDEGFDSFNAAEFDRGIEEFFDMMFAKVDRGEMTLNKVGNFFPEEVRGRY